MGKNAAEHAWFAWIGQSQREAGEKASFLAGFAAAIREDRAEPVSDAEVEAFENVYLEAIACTEKFAPEPNGIRIGLEAARQARANADESHRRPTDE